MLKVANSVINASQITGVLPVVNGGTGVTTSTGTGSVVLSAAPTLSGNVGLSTGNIVPATAGTGVNFTANTPQAGMTSQLLNWYEEGAWTPGCTAIVGSITSFTSVGKYTKVGRAVTIFGSIYLSNAGTGSIGLLLSGFPFTCMTTGAISGQGAVGSFNEGTTNAHGVCVVNQNATTGVLVATLVTGYYFDFTVTYQST